MLIEDRSTTTDFPPEAPRRWPKRLLVGGVVTLLLAAVAAFVVSAFALSGSSIEADGSSLGKVSTESFGGEVSGVKATAVKSGKEVPVEMKGDRILPKGKLHPGEQVKVEVSVKRPSTIGWLAGGTKTLTTTVTAPSAKPRRPLADGEGRQEPATSHLSGPVSEVAYGAEGEMKHRRFDKPRDSFTLGEQPTAGSLQVAVAAEPWEHLGQAEDRHLVPGDRLADRRRDPDRGHHDQRLDAARNDLLGTGEEALRLDQADALTGSRRQVVAAQPAHARSSRPPASAPRWPPN